MCILLMYICPSIQEYQAIFSSAGTNPGDKTLEDKFYEREVGAVKQHMQPGGLSNASPPNACRLS